MSQPDVTDVFDSTDLESVMALSEDVFVDQDRDLMNHLTNAEEVTMQRDGPDSSISEESEYSVCTEDLSVSSADSADLVETRRQTRSRTASKAEKEKTPDNSQSGVGKSVFTPRVVLYSYRNFKKYMGVSVQDNPDHSAASVNKDPDVRNSENRPSQPRDRSNRRGKKAVRPDRELITLSRRRTGPTHGHVRQSDSAEPTNTNDGNSRQSDRTEPTNTNDGNSRQSDRTEPNNTNKRKSRKDSSFQILRIRKSADNVEDSANDISKAVEAFNRKNAEMAKRNRMKKKLYLENLEQEVEAGRQTIGELRSTVKDLDSERETLKKEVQYLRSVLANQSVLATLLRNIPGVSGATLSSSMTRDRRAADPAAEGPSCAKKQKSPGGVCLHVDDGRVSIEACRSCADMASAK